MKINKELACNLLLESISFREFVVNEMFKKTHKELVNAVKSICESNRLNKIRAIKEIRELSKETSPEAFFEAYNVGYNGDSLGLGDAKKIVEKYI